MGLTLLRVSLRTNLHFLQLLIVILMINEASSIASRKFFVQALTNMYYQNGKLYDWLFCASAVTAGLSTLLFYLAMWMFSFKFWTLSLKMELLY
jgi:hypothetical protein